MISSPVSSNYRGRLLRRPGARRVNNQAWGEYREIFRSAQCPLVIAPYAGWKPWEKSTGPKSAEGKAKVARNPYRGSERQLLRELRRALREQAEALKVIG